MKTIPWPDTPEEHARRADWDKKREWFIRQLTKNGVQPFSRVWNRYMEPFYKEMMLRNFAIILEEDDALPL